MYIITNLNNSYLVYRIMTKVTAHKHRTREIEDIIDQFRVDFYEMKTLLQMVENIDLYIK